ncbi:aminotransferase class I/II-fold pyridoxal phosphate-dependent enzyme [Roseococcus thiosulfatophilus]|uniref:aminotransferase class I/II-fold pyridoxal phosphate-dependent enzyme n=1 Tax=Roseococcus thiosulfatophilus TaxID=35813 RepID=UPI001A8C0D72|nr:aminotransferase class I/II-fold pyridoxal phosphate-dependent enzyme [Roseococcus thiosulfatophilus]
MSGGPPRRRGLSPQERAALLGRMNTPTPTPSGTSTSARDFSTLPAAREVAAVRNLSRQTGISSPYFHSHEGIAGAHTRIAGREMINFSSYNYLGLNGDPRIHAAAREAIARYGVSASASRYVSGERPVHAALEAALARHHGVEDAVAMVSGHATNVTTIGHLVGPADLILHDALIHNSAAEGMRLSGARRAAFPHNDAAAAGALLAAERGRHNRALILIEGHYSMDGTVPDLAAFVALARRHDAWLMVDEAHSLGVLGPTGRGVAEAQGVDPREVDIWMGTLSKALASTGGYIAGSHVLVDMLRHTAPGFVYSVGLPPPLAVAAEAALGLIAAEPWRVTKLQANARRFRDQARAAGFDAGQSAGFGIVPIVLGDSYTAMLVADRLVGAGINVQPICFPVVPEGQARLRFFLSSEHSEADLDRTIEALRAAAREAA